MEINFEICKYDVDSISITGLEKESELYCSNDCMDDYSYEETVSVNVVIPVYSNQIELYEKIVWDLVDHSEQEYDHSIIKIPKDGLYKVVRLIVPIYDIVKGGYSGILAKKVDDGWEFYYNNELSTIEELVLSEGALCSSFYDYQYTFTIQNLRNCYYSKVLNYFDNYCSNKCELPVDVDIIWMAINTILYQLDLGKLFPALKLLETIQDCTGICNYESIKGFNYACGCSR